MNALELNGKHLQKEIVVQIYPVVVGYNDTKEVYTKYSEIRGKLLTISYRRTGLEIEVEILVGSSKVRVELFNNTLVTIVD